MLIEILTAVLAIIITTLNEIRKNQKSTGKLLNAWILELCQWFLIIWLTISLIYLINIHS